MLHLTEAKHALERPNSPGEEVHQPPQAPASPSHSWSSTSTEPLPLQHNDLESSPSAENRPKRCKISREQLAVLIKSFDEEPLPNFDQRQSLAKMLGMTPRSVQIWFQNRRQRLKPAVHKVSSTVDEGSGSLPRRQHSLSHGAHSSQPSTASQQAAAPAVQHSRAEFGMPGLAAAAASLCSSFPPDPPRMIPHHLQHLHPASSNMKSYNLGYDVMEPFAATKALLGAGYHPPSSLFSRIGAPPHLPSGNSPTAGGCSSGGRPAHASDSRTLPSAPASFLPPGSAITVGAALATHSPQAIPHTGAAPVCCSSDPQSHTPAQTDGLLLLLACADGSSSRAAHYPQTEPMATAAVVA
uniref:Homeobox domain-containing protein n=1 Tax=Coccolithus braarudii TaxID=221442 RepID=A0A7S0LRM0_9EUKA